MKYFLIFVSAFFSLNLYSYQSESNRFPVSPVVSMTPGSLCKDPDTYRYPEKIPYCVRAVSSETKNEVMKMYDDKMGYQVLKMTRSEFKIDHYIPLCLGGSNDMTNLWPQHQTIFKVTDPLEPLLCGKLAEGKILQKDAVELIRTAKEDISKVAEIIKYVQSL